MKKRFIFSLAALLLLAIASYVIFIVWPQHHQPLTLYGNVDIRDVNIGFRVGGRLADLSVDEGDSVKKGAVVGHLDADPYVRELHAAEAILKQAEANLIYAETVYLREKKLAGTGASTADRYQNASSSLKAATATVEKAKADVSIAALHVQDSTLIIPSDGVVLTRVVEPGSLLAANATVLTISLTDPIWVRAYISERELTKAKQGTHVKVYTDSTADKAFDGVIGFVSPTAEFTPKTVETTDLRTDLVYRLRIIMRDPQHELRQGMPVTVKLMAP